MLGPLAAALLLTALDVRGVLLVDATTFVISAAVLARLPAVPRQLRARPQVSFLVDTKEGLKFVATTSLVRTVVAGYFLVVAFNGIDDVALVFLAKDTLRGSDSAAGLLLGAVGIGLFLGYVLLFRRAAPLSMITLLLGGFTVSSLGNLLTGFAWALTAAFIMQTIRGLGIAAMDVAANTLVQRSVPPDLHGRVFGALHGAIGVAAAVSYLFGGLS
jgi:MFS family permease